LISKNPNISEFNRAYLIGIGGIGMSSLARYFNSKSWAVGGYDKTRTELTQELENEGIEIHYDDLGASIPDKFKDKQKTLVIFTPAVPEKLGELQYLHQNEFAVYKRAQVLGMITRNTKALAVAGTHGKTTTSSLLAHILNESKLKCNAFLGGISTNLNSNFTSNEGSKLTVIEADEFDHSFLHLNPFASIITSTDTDHLDIYENEQMFLEGFQKFANLNSPDGFIIKHADIDITSKNTLNYGVDCKAHYSGSNLRATNQAFFFDLKTPDSVWENVELGVPGIHNTENAIACIAMCSELGLSEEEIRSALISFTGVKRRFEYHIRTDNLVFIDDYAHHPTELKALITSVKLMYPEQKITGIFQPHLFTRTRDFLDKFALELSQLDKVILLPIYGAREEPIPGITSEALLDKITANNKIVLPPAEAIQDLRGTTTGIILTIGAGDIDQIVAPIKTVLES